MARQAVSAVHDSRQPLAVTVLLFLLSSGGIKELARESLENKQNLKL